MAAREARLLTPDAASMPAEDVPDIMPPAPAASRTELRVAVGRQGRVIGCDISRSSGWAPLDAAACRGYAARARFEPARDGNGAATCDVVWVSISWPTVRPEGRSARRRQAEPPGPLRQQLNARLCPGWRP